MNFALTTPCKACPFRSDIPGYLRVARVTEIERSLERGTFPCHLTVDYDEEEGLPRRNGPREQHCAGALILLMRLRRPSQLMRIAMRLRWFDPGKLDLAAPVYASFTAMRTACRGAESGPPQARQEVPRP